LSRFPDPRAFLASAVVALAFPAVASALPAYLGPTLGTGTPGGAAGQLNRPTTAAIDADGNMYVGEVDNDRVSVFAPDGTFLRAFGFDVDPDAAAAPEVCTTVCKAGVGGTAAGQMDGPTGVAVGGSEVYVADNGNRRIDVYTKTGTFLRAFGHNVDTGGAGGFEVCTANCQAGTMTSPEAGAVSNPYDVDLDGAGNLFVIENVNSRISVFGAVSSSFQRAFGYNVDPGGSSMAVETCTFGTGCQAATPGAAAGQVAAPLGMDVDATGTIYVADQVNDRVVVFNTAGAFLRAFGYDVNPLVAGSGLETCTLQCQAGVGGTGSGQLEAPRGVGSDGAGKVYVGDQTNARVALFTPSGGFQHAFGFDVDTGGSGGFEVCTTSCQAGDAGPAAGQLTLPEDVVVDCRGAIYAVDGTGRRIQRFGEPGTPLPPCPSANPPVDPPVDPPIEPPVKPSNEFKIGKLKRNTKKGTGKLTVATEAAGLLELAGKLVKPRDVQVAAGETRLPVAPKGKAKEQLAELGKAKIGVSLTFTPTGGDPNTQTKKLKLKREG
jgi:hypothetical protein